MYISHSGVCASSMAFLYIYGLCKTEKFVHINRYGSYTETLCVIITQNQESNAILRQKNNLKLYYENNLQKTKSKP